MASSSAHTKPYSLATILVIVSCCTHLVLAARELTPAGDDKAMRERHEKWMAEHGRTYKDSAEKARRFEVFRTNAHFIDSYNAAAGQGGKSGRPALVANKFADLTKDEFSSMYLGQHGSIHRPASPVIETDFMYADVRLEDIPASIDWREKGAVTRVKDQSDTCDCCWAFSAVAAVEGIHQIRTHKLVSLSEQQLLDCSTGRNNRGCNLGDAEEAFRYIALNAITKESAYLYEGNQSTCRSSGKHVAARINGFQYVPPQNETALLLAVAHQPVSVALDGNNTEFKSWSGTGIYGAAGESCKNDLNHAMTIVGYGTDDNGTKYWLMKNSWGIGWADEGYVKMARDVASNTGLCGLAMQASYPVA